MMNKKGWLRIVEASMAILIILGVLFAIYQRQQNISEEDLSEKARNVLEEISQNETLRDQALTGNSLEINKTIANYFTQSNIAFEVRICDLNDVCGKSTYTAGNVYTAERVISASIENPDFAPKKMRLFIWRK